MKLTLRRPDRRVARDLETERFLMPALGTLEAIRWMRGWRRDPEILRGMFHSSRPLSRWQWLARAPIPNNVDRFAFGIVPRETGVPIGINAVRYRDNRTASMSVALSDRGWWGKNVVLEVRARVIGHVFANAPVDRLVGFVYGRNFASIFNYQQLGFRQVGIWRRQFRDPATGEQLDMAMFELLREDWPGEREQPPR